MSMVKRVPKIIAVCFLTLLLVMTTGFVGGMPINAASISVGTKTASFTAASATKSIKVSSSKAWSIGSKSGSWFSCSKSGNYIRITAQANGSPTARSGYVYVRSGLSSVKITVKQSANALTLGSNTCSLGGQGAYKAISVTAKNGSFSVADDSSWITTVKYGNSVKITAAQNTSGKARTGYVTVKSGTIAKKIKVTQTMHTIVLGSTSKTVEAKSGSYKFSVVSSSYSGWTVKSNASWIAATRTNTDIYVTVKANPTAYARTGTVTVSAGGAKKVITIKQLENCLSASTYKVYVNGPATTKTVVVMNNAKNYIATCDVDWAKVKKTSTGISISIMANNESRRGECRYGQIKLVSGDFIRAISIRQQAYTLNISGGKKTVSSDAYNGRFSFETDCKRPTAKTDESWITFVDCEGTGVDQFEVLYDLAANTSTESRTGVIRVWAGKVYQDFYIVQEGVKA